MAQEPYHWQLTDEDGLPSMTVYNIQQDRSGYMWFGTAAGLCRFDGKKFEYFRHSEQLDDEIIYLHTDNFNRVWYSNLAGQMFYIKDNVVKKSPALFDKNAYALRNFKISDDYFIIQTDTITAQAFHKSPAQIIILKLEESLNFKDKFIVNSPRGSGAFVLKQNHLFFFSYSLNSEEIILNKRGIGSIDDILETSILSLEEREFLSTSRAFQLIRTEQNELVVFADNKVLFLSEGKKEEQFSAITLPTNIDNAIEIKNQFLMTDPKGGIHIFDRLQGKTTNYILKDYLINRAFLDTEENLWLSTKNSGLIIIPDNDKNLINSSNSPLTSHVAQTIANGFNNQTIVGTKKGDLFFFKKGKFQYLMKIPSATSIYSIAPNKKNNHLVVGTNETIIEIDKDKKILSDKNRKTQFSIKKIAFDNQNKLWVGNYTHCRIVEESEIGKNNYILDAKKIVNHRTYGIHADFEENVWIGSTQGLFKYTNEKASPFLIDGVHNKYYFTSIIQSKFDSSIWAGTHGDGLLQIKNNQLVNHYKEDNQLASNICNDLFADSYNNLWIATSKGLQKLDLETTTFELINKYDGLPTNEISNVAVNDSIVYVGTNKGIITFGVDSETENKTSPPIYFTNFSILDKDTTLQELYELDYDQSSLQIDFIGLAYKCRGDVRYKYRMIGIDTNWVTTNTRFARFPGMSKGDYEFQVVALNEDNVESLKPATLKICIAPPYWETWWFRAGAFILGVSLIGGFFNFRYKTIRKREKLEFDFKNQLNDLRAQALQTQMNPHFIFNSMNAIQHFLTTQDKENAMIYLSRFAKLIRFIFEQSKQKTISLQKELEFLELYISLEKLRFQDKVSARIDVDSSVAGFEEDIHLPPLLIQPVVENAFKHGLFHKNGEGNLHIKFSYQEPILSCTVEDDGIGREKSALLNEWRKNTHTSSGIKATKERIELLNNTTQTSHPKTKENSFEIIDLSEKGQATGTKVEIKLKNQFIYD